VSLFPKFNHDELVRFIQCMDLLIEEPTDLIVVGGAAATLAYGATGTTKDIDTWDVVPPAVLKAAEEARVKTGLEVPIESPRVADVPYHYEDRLELLSMGLEKLRIFVPEQHDLALMKVVRGDRQDEDVIAEIHERHPFDLETLLERFEKEMDHVIKDERILRSQFRSLISRLFGPEAAKRIPSKRKPGAGGSRV
jgi:hypothetical protein